MAEGERRTASADLSNATVLPMRAATARSLAARFGDYVDINDFGLARDGVTDDSARVLAAVNAAMANAGKLYVPSGGPILLAGAAQVSLQGIAVVGDGLTDIGFPYGRIGSQFWITDVQKSAFLLNTNVTLDGLVFFYPNQADQPSAPIAYPPLFTPDPNAVQVAMLTINNCQVTNAYDVLTIPESIICGDVIISNNRICAVNTCFTLPNVPEVIYLTNNLFTFGIYEVEYLHGPGGGTRAQTVITLPTVADAPASSTTLSFANASSITAGAAVAGNGIAPNALVTAVTGNTVTIDSGNLADVPSGSSVTFTEDQYYLRNFTAKNATWLLITENGTANAASAISHGGIIATNDYVFGYRYGIHIDGGTLLIGRLTNTGFDEVGTVLQCDNHGTVYDLQIDNFLTFGLLSTTSDSPPTTLSVIDNPPPDSSGNATARLSISSMTVGFSTGTLFDISDVSVSEVKISGCKLTRFANVSSGQPYYALRISAPNARLLFSGNDIIAASGGNIGVQISAIDSASIVGNVFSFLQAAVDVETTAGLISLSGNMSRGTVGPSAVIGTGTGNIEDYGNAWDQRPLNWNPVMPSYVSTALNGLSSRGDGGFGVSVNALGSSPDVTLNLITSGAGSISMLTRGFSPQFVVLDSANNDTIFVTGDSSGLPASINSRGPSNSGLALQNSGGGTIQLGSTGVTGSSIVHKGAVADQSYSAPAGIGSGTYQVPNNTSDVQLTTGAGSIASMTVILPAQPLDGQVLDVASVASISALSVQSGSGAGLAGSPTSLPANGCIRFKYFGGAINRWFHRAFN